MLVGVIADTHDNVPAVEVGVDEFENRDVVVVVHWGDVVDTASGEVELVPVGVA